MSHRGIVLARDERTLCRCGLCGNPVPPEQASQVPTPRGSDWLCVGCWSQAGGARLWLMEPAVQGLAAVRVVLLAMLHPYAEERGQDGNPIRTLQRLLGERELLRLDAINVDAELVSCCYCCERLQGPEETANLISVEDCGGLPDIWHCKDYAACDQRFARRLQGMLQAMAAPKQ